MDNYTATNFCCTGYLYTDIIVMFDKFCCALYSIHFSFPCFASLNKCSKEYTYVCIPMCDEHSKIQGLELYVPVMITRLLYTSGPVSLQERLLYTLNKLFIKQVKSFLLLLDLDPFIFQCSPHNIKYI